MKTIHAIYEDGVFRPIGPVNLPSGSRVTVQPEDHETTSAAHPETDGLDPIYEVLSRRHRSGHRDTAERHNEHQP